MNTSVVAFTGIVLLCGWPSLTFYSQEPSKRLKIDCRFSSTFELISIYNLLNHARKAKGEF